MRELTLVKTMRDSLQTLLLHHQFNEKARDFFKAVRLGDFAEARSRMSATWQGVTAEDLRDMIRNDLPLLPLSTATHFGLVMDRCLLLFKTSYSVGEALAHLRASGVC